jgi:hypothetical protein
VAREAALPSILTALVARTPVKTTSGRVFGPVGFPPRVQAHRADWCFTLTADRPQTQASVASLSNECNRVFVNLRADKETFHV